MKRLVQDAGVVTRSFDNIREVSFAELIESIHVIQERLGVTGTTALEAQTTIQGSLKMVQSAWSNLKTAMADPSQDVSMWVSAWVNAAGVFAKNVIPRIKQAFESISTVIDSLTPILAREIPGMVESILPSLINAATQIVSALATQLPALIGSVISSLGKAITSSNPFGGLAVSAGLAFATINKSAKLFGTNFTGIIKGVVNTTKRLFAGDLVKAFSQFRSGMDLAFKKQNLADWSNEMSKNVIAKMKETGNSATLMGYQVQSAFNRIPAAIKVGVPVLATFSALFAELYTHNERFKQSVDDLALAFLKGFGNGLKFIDADFGSTVQEAAESCDSLTDAFKRLGDWFNGEGGDALAEKMDGMKEAAETIGNVFGLIVGTFSKVLNIIKPIFMLFNQGMKILNGSEENFSPDFEQKMGKWIDDMFGAEQSEEEIAKTQEQINQALADFDASGMIDGTKMTVEEVNKLKEAGQDVATATPNTSDPWAEFFGGIQRGAGEAITGISEFFSSVGGTIGGWFAGIGETIGNFFGSIPGFFAGIGEAIGGFFAGIGETLGGWISGIGESIGSFFTSIPGFFIETFGNIWTGITEFFANVGNTIMNFVMSIPGFIASIPGFIGNLMSNIGNAVGSGIQAVIDWFAGLPGRIVSALGNLGGMLVEAGKNIIDGFLSGIKSAFEGVKDFVSGIGEWIAEHKGPKQYDLHLLIPHGKWIMQSLSKGLQEGLGGVQKTLDNVTGTIASEIYVNSSIGNSGNVVSSNANSLETQRPIVVNINGTRINDDAQITEQFKLLFGRLQAKGAM